MLRFMDMGYCSILIEVTNRLCTRLNYKRQENQQT